MLEGEELRDIRDIPVLTHRSCDYNDDLFLKERESIRIAKLSDKRFVDIIYDSVDCEPGIIPADVNNAELIYCPEGNVLSLFPATSIYITATVVQPNARHYDRELDEFVTGPVESKIFYQFAGIVPDLNKNGIDDLIDIREGTEKDINGNGVIDGFEPGEEDQDEKPDSILWIFIIVIMILVILYALLLRKRKKNTVRG